MISLAPGTRVYLASQPVSMRLGFDGLVALVRPLFSVEPYAGHVFLFRSRSDKYLKVLHWDDKGLCLFAKRLERHRFVCHRSSMAAWSYRRHSWRCSSRRWTGGARSLPQRWLGLSAQARGFG